MQCIYFRSYDRSSRSLDQESPSKKKKFQTNYASTTHLLAGKKVPSSLQTKSSDVETTVFYIPGVDVKVKGVYKLNREALALSLCSNMISTQIHCYSMYKFIYTEHLSKISFQLCSYCYNRNNNFCNTTLKTDKCFYPRFLT